MGKIDFSALASRLEGFTKRGETREKVDYGKLLWKPEKGKEYEVRLLPSKYNESMPFTEMYFHQNLDVKYPVLAMKDNDPIAKLANELKKSADATQKQLGKDLTPRLKVFVPVIVRGEEEKGVRLYQFSTEQYESFLRIAANTKQNGDIFDVKEGSDFDVTSKPETLGVGKGTYLKATWTIHRKSSPLSENAKQVKEWLENQPDPAALYELKSEEELKDLVKAKINAMAASEGIATTPTEPAATTQTSQKVDEFAKLFE